ncbi:MAG: T9SS type A sorting domain-containing protein [Saprospirales bacterium]|nr:T9SS type A sorting domain-containing protein [Saprospirales bacterium]MBK8492906.1 T9SS type A sorting domain-containing protein [Saprospirales bacterium]
MRQYMYVTTPACYNAIYDLEPTPDGGYVMVGEARPYNAFDTLFPPPIQQGWILKVDEWGCLVPGCQLDVGTEDMPGDNPMTLKVYSNPASEVLYIHMPDAKPSGRFSLVDATGRRVKEFDASTGDMTYILSLDGAPPGWYVVVYEEAGGRRLAEEVVVE